MYVSFFLDICGLVDSTLQESMIVRQNSKGRDRQKVQEMASQAHREHEDTATRSEERWKAKEKNKR